MGFGDKLKAGLSNTSNYAGQKVDETRYYNKISEQKSAKNKAISEAADKMFTLYKGGNCNMSDEVKALFDKAIACDAEIEKLEKEMQDMKDEAHAKREAKWESAKNSDDKKE